MIVIYATYAYPQDDLSRFTGQKIQSIKVISTIDITERNIERECGIKKGDLFSISAIKTCITSFYKKGLFKDIIVEAYGEGDGVGIQYTFIGKMKVGNIKIKGNAYFSARRIKSIAGLKKGDELTDTVMAEIRRRILNLYQGTGFFDTSANVESVLKEKELEVQVVIVIEEGKRANTAGIVFNGERALKDEELLTVFRLQPGDYYNEKDIDLSIKRLEKHYIEKGYLKVLISPPDLLYDETKGEVLITLSIEAGPHVDVLFEGVDAIDHEVLRKELLIWKERAFDTAILDESAERLREYYKKNGYYFATVNNRMEKGDERDFKIIFTVTEGIPVTVKEIGFRGNSYFKSKKLKEYLHVKEEKFLDEGLLKEDIKEIINLYRNSGFLEIKIAPEITFNEEDTTLSINLIIEEGVQTFIKEILLEGNNTFSRREIMSHIKSKEGEPYNELQAIDALYNIQSFYVQKGYIYSSIDLKSSYSEDKKEVTVYYKITEDKPVYIGDIILSGNSFTKEYVIRRELLVKEDDLYSYENILRSQRRLLVLGIFKNVKLDPINPEIRDYRKDLSLKIEEGYPGTVEFGVGYGDVERFRGMFDASYRNLFGTGRQTTLRVEGSSIEQKYSLGYKEPWVLGYKMDGRLNLVDLLENKRSFDRRTLGITTGLDKSFSDFVKFSLMYQYEDVKLSRVSVEAILTPEDTGKVEVATINPSLIIDRRDDPFNPSKGAFYSIAFREAARFIGSMPQFAKVNLQSSFFYSPFRKLVFALSFRGGIAWNFGESTEVPIFERYFAGGRNTVRGYEQERLGIPGKTIIFDGQKWNPTGGNVMMVINGEIRLPLFRGLAMVAFVDSGNIWSEMEEFDIKEVRSTAGVGIRYDTPVGPLRLDLGCKLDREVGEDRCLPHFTLGHAF